MTLILVTEILLYYKYGRETLPPLSDMNPYWMIFWSVTLGLAFGWAIISGILYVMPAAVRSRQASEAIQSNEAQNGGTAAPKLKRCVRLAVE